jgi:hypothetical protein
MLIRIGETSKDNKQTLMLKLRLSLLLELSQSGEQSLQIAIIVKKITA